MSIFSLYLAYFSPICVSTYSWSPSPTRTPTQSPKPQRNWEQVSHLRNLSCRNPISGGEKGQGDLSVLRNSSTRRQGLY